MRGGLSVDGPEEMLVDPLGGLLADPGAVLVGVRKWKPLRIRPSIVSLDDSLKRV